MAEQSVKCQYFAALVANLLTMAFGMMEGWNSPSIMLLRSNETPLPSGMITMEEASWIASLMSIGCLFGNISFGYIMNKFGRKRPLLCITAPIIVGWLLVLYSQNVYYLYAFKLLNGFFGGAGYIMVPLFLSEIANDRNRGFIVSTLVLSENFGVVSSLMLGNYCDFYTIPKVAIALTSLFAVSFFFFPESPIFLLKQNKISETYKSIRFYRNGDDAGIKNEMNKLKHILDEVETENSLKKSFKLTDLTTGIGRKAMTIGIGVVALNQLSGCVAITNYAAVLFEEAGSNLSPNMSAVVLGTLQLVGSFSSINLVDRAGRNNGAVFGPFFIRPFLIFSGFFVQLNDAHPAMQWLFHASFLKYALEGGTLAIFSYERERMECSQLFCQFVLPKKFIKIVDMHNGDYMTAVIALLVIFFLVRFIAFYVMSFRVRSKR